MTDQPKDPAAVTLGRRGGLANAGIPKPHAAANLKGARGGRERGPSAEDLYGAIDILKTGLAQYPDEKPSEVESVNRVIRWLDRKAKRRAEGKGI